MSSLSVSVQCKRLTMDIIVNFRLKYSRGRKDLTISSIDQDRLDIHDFLKRLKKCDSDDLPEAKQ